MSAEKGSGSDEYFCAFDIYLRHNAERANIIRPSPKIGLWPRRCNAIWCS